MTHGQKSHARFGATSDPTCKFECGEQLVDAVRKVPGVHITDAPGGKVNVSTPRGNARIHAGQQPLSMTEKRSDLGNLKAIGITVATILIGLVGLLILFAS